MSEPRLHIKNCKTGRLLHVTEDWKANTIGNEHAGEQDVKFKVQCCEKTGKFASTVMIRTDCHPQKLLDANDLAYQGDALDSNKRNDKNRWWKLHYLEVSETKVTVMFESYSKENLYLAETDDKKVTLIPMDNSQFQSHKNSPNGRAQWDLAIGGRALTTGQVAGVIVGAPLAAAGIAIVTVSSLGALTNALAAVGAATLAVLAGANNVVNNVLAEVSDNLFVD